MRLKIYKFIFIILIILSIIVIGLIGYKYYSSYANEKRNQDTVTLFSNYKSNNEENLIMEGYKVIGIVKIPKINIEYPILDLETYNPEETNEPMKFSIVKYWGVGVNEYGNISIAGHNKYDGTMFGKTKYLEIGDIVELTDLNKTTIKYNIYDKFVTDPNDITILSTTDESIREVTLITCTNGNKARLILKAKEIKD